MAILSISYLPQFIINSFFIRKYKNSHISYFPKKEISADKYFTILYIKSVPEAVGLFKMNSKLAYSIPNTLNKYIKRGKDQLDILLYQRVMYEIFCENCDASGSIMWIKRRGS